MKFIIAVASVVLVGVVVFFVTSGVSKTPEELQNTEEEVLPTLLPIKLASRTVTFSDGSKTAFEIAEDFEIVVAAEDLGKARFMAMSPDNRMFLADMVDLNLSPEGRILILDDFNEETHSFETTSVYLSGLRGPNSIAFYTDTNGDDWIYLTLTDRLIRYPYSAGDVAPRGEPEVIARFLIIKVPQQLA